MLSFLVYIPLVVGDSLSATVHLLLNIALKHVTNTGRIRCTRRADDTLSPSSLSASVSDGQPDAVGPAGAGGAVPRHRERAGRERAPVPGGLSLAPGPAP